MLNGEDSHKGAWLENCRESVGISGRLQTSGQVVRKLQSRITRSVGGRPRRRLLEKAGRNLLVFFSRTRCFMANDCWPGGRGSVGSGSSPSRRRLRCLHNLRGVPQTRLGSEYSSGGGGTGRGRGVQYEGAVASAKATSTRRREPSM